MGIAVRLLPADRPKPDDQHVYEEVAGVVPKARVAVPPAETMLQNHMEYLMDNDERHFRRGA